MELMTVEEVSEYLKVHPEVVRRWLREKRLPGIKIGKNGELLKRDLDKYLKSLKINSWQGADFTPCHRVWYNRVKTWPAKKVQ